MPKPKNIHSFYFSEILSRIIAIYQKYQRWIILLAAVIALKILAPNTFIIVIIACFLYMILYPAVEYLDRKLKSPKLAALLLVVVLTGLLIFAMAVIIPAFVNQAISLLKDFESIKTQTVEKIALMQSHYNAFQKTFSEITKMSLSDSVNKYYAVLSNSLMDFFKGILNSLSKITTSLIHILVAYVVFIYFLFDNKSIIGPLNSFFLKEASFKEKKFLILIYEQFASYFGGLFLLSVIKFFIVWIFLALLGVKFSLLLSLWVAVMELIPFFGPLLGLIPVVLFAWVQSVQFLVPILIFYLILQLLLSNIIAPSILGKSTKLSPLTVFLVMLIGAEIFGIWGMIFSLPLASIIALYFRIQQSKV
jgi:predicted PurR-regulated permease PerM